MSPSIPSPSPTPSSATTLVAGGKDHPGTSTRATSHGASSPPSARRRSTPPSTAIDPAGADSTSPLLSQTSSSAPGATDSGDDGSPEQPYMRHQPKSLSGIAMRSFCLGVALAAGLVATLWILLLTDSPLWRLPFFLVALATFHFLEFWTTAAYNTSAASISSFLLTANWPGYAISHAAASVECLVVGLLFPNRAWAPLHSGPAFLLAGLACVVVGQAVRSTAMVRAGRSFNHTVQEQRGRDHVLVTTGIYASLRHPSYFGFFWWALGTQLVLGNVVCFAAYAAVLFRFFSTRIRREEELLVTFFGDEYVRYRSRVGTGIPFIP